MPVSTETVPNRPLSGTELRDIILRDVERVLARDGMFTPHIGYSRVAYDFKLHVHMDNPSYPEHKVRVTSKNPPRNAQPRATNIEVPPIKNASDEAAHSHTKLERTIESPNKARLENNLPVTITRKDRNSGETVEQQVHYDATGLEPDAPKITELGDSDKDWGVE